MHNPRAFACERKNSSRIRKQEVAFPLSEANELGSFTFFSLVETLREREREREKEREWIQREESESERRLRRAQEK